MNQDPTHNKPVQQVVIVGGGSAGWLTAALLAAEFETSEEFSVTLVESPDTPTIGVGEGTWPSMRSTLKKIGLNEAEFLRRCQGSLKQGTYFQNWSQGKGESYYHPFSPPAGYSEVNLAEVWLEGGLPHRSFAHAVTPQSHVCDQSGTAKQLGIPDYAYALNYGYHLDAGAFAGLLFEHATAVLGVKHVYSHIAGVIEDSEGYIQALQTTAGDVLSGDLFIDCSGFQALLLGQHYQIPFNSVDSVLFNNRALAAQVPYETPGHSIHSTTWATAQRAGWVWDIGLRERRGVGYVFSSAHTDEATAEQTLATYLKQTTRSLAPEQASSEFRLLTFNPGYRDTLWHKNCVAVGLAGGFVEPLEASALVMVELAARAIADRFPATRDVMPVHAKRFNREFSRRWEHIIDFLKLHYVLSQRDDSDYWRDHRQSESVPKGLRERLALWQTEMPWHAEDERADELFPSASYQYVLMGMGFRPQLSGPPRRRQLEQRARSEELLHEVGQQAQRMGQHLPSNRQLLTDLLHRDFATL